MKKRIVLLAALGIGMTVSLPKPVIAQNRSRWTLDETVWRLASADHALVGLERPDRPVVLSEPTITGDIERDLDALVSQINGYEWRRVDRVYVVRPSTAWPDGNDILNRHTPSVHWRNIEIEQAKTEVAKLLYGETWGAGPPPTQTQRFSVTLPSSTLIHVLNAVAEQHGALVWIVRDIPPTSSSPWAVRVGVAFRDFNGTRAGFAGVTPKPTR